MGETYRRHEETSFFQGHERPIKGIPTDSVEHNIHAIRNFIEALHFVVDEFISAQTAHVVLVWCGPNCSNVRAHRLCKLHRKRANASRAIGNQQALAARKLGDVEHGLPCCEGSERYRRRLDEVEVGRFEGDVANLGDRILGKTARGDYAVDRVSDVELADANAKLLNDPRNLAAEMNG